ncbi:MAG: ABC transporter ATP-binding protein [Acidobacteria bacterium]|nr:ABC transporter ATP-binding protein [Acidobacteriota bacterium]
MTESLPRSDDMEAAASGATLLDVAVSVDYFGRQAAVREVRFSMERGEILGLIGESGSGKSTLAMAILGLLSFRGGKARGEIRLQGRDLLALPEREMRQVRGRAIGFVPQSPLAALNPTLRLDGHFREAWRAHRPDRNGWREVLPDLLRRVQLPREAEFLRQYPRQLSVGLAQRVLIALALLHNPRLIIADEPTSALDAITQSGVLSLLAGLNRDLQTSILFISHDLVSVARLSHRVAILLHGELVEQGPAVEVFGNPQHVYTRQLMATLLVNPLLRR